MDNSPAAGTCQHVATSHVVPPHKVVSDHVLSEQHRHWIVHMSGRNISMRVHAFQSLNKSLFECVEYHVFLIIHPARLLQGLVARDKAEAVDMQRHFPATLLQIECLAEPAFRPSRVRRPPTSLQRPSVRTSWSSNETCFSGRINQVRTPGRTDAGHDSGDTAGREPSGLYPSCASSWPFLALPAAGESPCGVRSEAGVDGAFLGSDGKGDAARIRRAAFRENMEVARTTGPRAAAIHSSSDDPRDPTALARMRENH